MLLTSLAQREARKVLKLPSHKRDSYITGLPPELQKALHQSCFKISRRGKMQAIDSIL